MLLLPEPRNTELPFLGTGKLRYPIRSVELRRHLWRVSHAPRGKQTGFVS
jgi:hypothetical protein